ncbi:MAG: PQQ-dependent sugar dehydrogenase [bacterium]|nr:PQQ-dependent sugar dehydrogenase [bacterium]
MLKGKVLVLAALSFLVMLLPASTVRAAVFLDGFTESLVVDGLGRPTAMALAPDGRIFITDQDGAVLVVRDGALLAEPFITLETDSRNERGVVGIAVDPNYLENQWVYIYYTVPATATDPAHNRIVRYTHADDLAVPGSEQVILNLDPLGNDTNHNGGGMHFGPHDGMLYLGTGENAVTPNAQSLESRLGKILRFRPDGTIPTDNPFYAEAEGDNRMIWAMGLRNPYTFAFNAAGRMLINDVGSHFDVPPGWIPYEEVNEGIAGANYGWPVVEGAFDPAAHPAFTNPLFTYEHTGAEPDDHGCAPTGGVFYEPENLTFPPEYHGAYLFADHCSGWIRRLDPATGDVYRFIYQAPYGLLDLDVSAAGDLYYLARAGTYPTGTLFRVHYGSP